MHPGADLHKHYRGAQGLAEDVRYYGKRMRDEAERRIGHLYPKARLLDGSEATVIAWLWARTVRSPDPRAKGAMVPLVSSFVLSAVAGKKAWVDPAIDPLAPDGWRFEVREGVLTKADEDRLKKGTKTARGTNFDCLLTGATISPDYIRHEGLASRFGARLMAIVAEGTRGRIYLTPTTEHEACAAEARPGDTTGIDVEMPENPRWFSPPGYGMKRYLDIFTPRQLLALTTFTDLVGDARSMVLSAAGVAGLSDDPTPLNDGGSGRTAYADAVATCLALTVTSLANSLSEVCTWDAGGPGWGTKVRNTFSRQALPMTWDFAEIGPFSGNSGSYDVNHEYIIKSISNIMNAGSYEDIYNLDAAKNNYPIRPIVISTDPPYYDNIGYADLSDFFYIWLKRSIAVIWPKLFRRLTTPKAEELVATPYRHGGREQAEAFFMHGMSAALRAMHDAASDREPLAIYYAFKQSELAEDGIVSPGWASFLQAVSDSGLAIDGTWPVRTELSKRMVARNANALASSIVLVCRKRAAETVTVSRADFLRALRREMPAAVEKIRRASVGPVDMPQSIIGPGMGIFTRYVRVLEDDDLAMTVKTALALINRVWGEIENDLDANFDPETQVALAWFHTYGFDARASGDLINIATAKNIPIEALFRSGVFQNLNGKAALTPREKLPEDWSPAGDRHLTVWECVQHTARVLRAEAGGAEPAARLVATMGAKAEAARALAYRLYEIASQKGWASEALVYNELAQDWTTLEDRAGGQPPVSAMRDLFGATAP